MSKTGGNTPTAYCRKNKPSVQIQKIQPTIELIVKAPSRDRITLEKVEISKNMPQNMVTS